MTTVSVWPWDIQKKRHFPCLIFFKASLRHGVPILFQRRWRNVKAAAPNLNLLRAVFHHGLLPWRRCWIKMGIPFVVSKSGWEVANPPTHASHTHTICYVITWRLGQSNQSFLSRPVKPPYIRSLRRQDLLVGTYSWSAASKAKLHVLGGEVSR